jgi:Ca2+/Na+ antiporter
MDMYLLGSVIAITALIFYLFHGDLRIGSKKITKYQKDNRFFLAAILTVSFLTAAIIAIFSFPHIESKYQLYSTIGLSVIVFLYLYFLNKKNARSTKIVDANLEASFPKLKVKKRKVKDSHYYAHFYSDIETVVGIKGEVVEARAKLSEDELNEFFENRIEKKFEKTTYFQHLLRYLSRKCKQLGIDPPKPKNFKNISQLNAEMQIAFLVEKITAKKYFIAIGQLSQYTSADELKFHVFLQDLQLKSYSSLSLHHAFIYEAMVQNKDLKEEILKSKGAAENE